VLERCEAEADNKAGWESENASAASAAAVSAAPRVLSPASVPASSTTPYFALSSASRRSAVFSLSTAFLYAKEAASEAARSPSPASYNATKRSASAWSFSLLAVAFRKRRPVRWRGDSFFRAAA
jgi:hypothetical protein